MGSIPPHFRFPHVGHRHPDDRAAEPWELPKYPAPAPDYEDWEIAALARAHGNQPSAEFILAEMIEMCDRCLAFNPRPARKPTKDWPTWNPPF